LGAEVTKVEKPGDSDVMRASPTGAYQLLYPGPNR